MLVNEVRGMLGYTGTWRGHGSPSTAPVWGCVPVVYVNEMIGLWRKDVIRIGSAGAMQPQVKVRDVVLAMSAATTTTPRPRSSGRKLRAHRRFRPVVKGLAAAQGKVDTHVGNDPLLQHLLLRTPRHRR